MKEKKNYDLEPRLIDFAVLIIETTNNLKSSYASSHLGSQLVRSGTSPALNYGEAQSAESRKDFIHKIKIILKELRESMICLKIIKKTTLFKSEVQIEKSIKECNELISIFVKSVETAIKNSTTNK